MVNDPFAAPTERPIEPCKISSEDASGGMIQRGRYKLAHPVTGEAGSWQRVTNFVSALDDAYALRQWSERRLAWGLGQRPGLVALLAASTLDEVTAGERDADIDRAKDHAGCSEGADLGTALHKLTQRYDMCDLEYAHVPENHRADLEAYQDAMMMCGLEVDKRYVERTTFVPLFGGGVVGTFDRLLMSPARRLCGWCPRNVWHVGDLKTGQNEIKYGQLKAAMQFALYAHGGWLLDPVDQSWVKAPEICQHVGVMMHLPVGKAQSDLHLVDLELGREALFVAERALAVRRFKGLVTPW